MENNEIIYWVAVLLATITIGRIRSRKALKKDLLLPSETQVFAAIFHQFAICTLMAASCFLAIVVAHIIGMNTVYNSIFR